MVTPLIGQVYNLEGFDYDRTVNKVKEKHRRVEFRLGQDKPYKVKKIVQGEEKEVREKTFITCKCFTAIAETLETYFGGEENKGRWIQIMGHFEENAWDKEVEIEDPENPGRVLVMDVPTKRLEFIISSFSFIGEPPAPPAEKKQTTSDGKAKVKVKTKATSGTTADDAARDLAEEEAPF